MVKKIILCTILVAFLFTSCKNNFIAEHKNVQKDIPVTDIRTNEDDVSIVTGTAYQLTAKVFPENAVNQKLDYSSSDKETASVDGTGLITAHRTGGPLTITIRSVNNIQKTVRVTVIPKPIPVENIEFTNPFESLVMDDTYELKVKVTPDEATDKKVLYTAETDNIRIDENGKITALKDGNAVIAVKSESNPAVEKKLAFTVKKKPEIKIETDKVIQTESTAESVQFKIETLYGKLDYTPVIQDGAPWLTEVTKESTNATEDILTLNYKENKTVWYREAFVKLKDDKTGKYIKSTDGRNDIAIKLIQKSNDNPVVTVRWVRGVNGPSESEKERLPIPPAGTEFYSTSYIFNWNETENTKFFNTRKISYIQGAKTMGNHDLHQCWAKTSSNMLHWWFEQNKELIDRYTAKKNLTEDDKKQYDAGYIRGLPDEREHEKSFIANIFRTKCGDSPRGSYIQSGLRWYLFGLDNFAKDGTSPALFKDIFTNGTSPIKTYRIYSKEEFETVIKDALNEGKAMGIDIMGTNYAHAITLWGAAFDEEENIIAVYVVDNNLKENRVFTYGIHYLNNIYQNQSNNSGNFPYLINYAGGFKDKDKHIGFIVTLDRGTEQFERWFSKNR